jgi:hypothetical protein
MWLSCARLVPVPAGRGSSPSTVRWSRAGPDGQGESEGWGSGHPTHGWGSAGPEGWWAGEGRDSYHRELWDRLWAGVRCRQVVGISVVMDPVVQLRGTVCPEAGGRHG